MNMGTHGGTDFHLAVDSNVCTAFRLGFPWRVVLSSALSVRPNKSQELVLTGWNGSSRHSDLSER